MKTFAIVAAFEDGIGYSYGTNRVICKIILIGEEFKIIIVRSVELVAATYNIANNCT